MQNFLDQFDDDDRRIVRKWRLVARLLRIDLGRRGAIRSAALDARGKLCRGRCRGPRQARGRLWRWGTRAVRAL